MTTSEHSQVSGLLLVRLVGMDKDPAGRGFYSSQAPCLGTLCYGGIDRMPWFDLDEPFYSGSLPIGISALRETLNEANNDFTGIKVCKDLPTALELLAFSNEAEVRNELIAIRSGRLAEIKGTIELGAARCSWIGYDVVSLGNWSLLREGVFHAPASFPGWEKVINGHGLLSSPDFSDECIDLYVKASREGQVEELPDSPYGIDVIEVGRVRVP